MTTLTVEAMTQNNAKETELSPKTTAWCRKVAGIAIRRAFRVKSLEGLRDSLNADDLKFFFLPKIYHRKRISHTDRASKIFLHPEFFDDKGNIRRKLPKSMREELKAAIYKEIVHFAFNRTNTDFYKAMVRCSWRGPRVDGALGSSTEARNVLAEKKCKKLAQRRKVVEVPTGLTEDVEMWDLVEGKNVVVKGAQIFLADGKIKVARGEHNGKKLRKMLPGGAELAKQLA